MKARVGVDKLVFIVILCCLFTLIVFSKSEDTERFSISTKAICKKTLNYTLCEDKIVVHCRDESYTVSDIPTGFIVKEKGWEDPR